MKNKTQKNNFTKRLIFTAVAFSFVVGASVLSFLNSERLNQIEPETSEYFFETSPVEAERNDIPDNRIEEKEETEKTEEKKEEKTQKTELTTAAQPETKLANKSYSLPCSSEIIKEYSPSVPLYSETMGDWRTHSGVDFAAKQGDKIYASGYGKVSKVYADSKWGYVIEIDYDDFVLRYCGISQNGAVSIEEAVSPGGIIGEVAVIPAEEKDGLHFHVEAIKDGKTVDPFEAMRN
ncbi:MAG: M23 family metallopeptidase [Clostridia bacterium]|nr:M23 family metallopeptidase [Clostridia bacterium]